MPIATAVSREADVHAFVVGDDVRVRGRRTVVVEVRIDAVRCRGLAGWIDLDDVTESE